MRIMREEPPRGRYWYQNVREPEGRMRTPKPLTSVSQRKSWPVLGLCARFTLASVSFFPMRSSDSVSTAFCAQISSGALRSNMAGYVGKSRQTGASLVFYLARSGGTRGKACPGTGRARRPLLLTGIAVLLLATGTAQDYDERSS